MTIDSFSGEYEFLSNFFTSPFYYEGVVYESNEHFFQSHKAVGRAARLYIRQAPTAAEAKDRGRSRKGHPTFEMVPDWDPVWSKITMRIGLLMKFTQNPFLMESLIATGDEQLIEGNYWKDTTWGCVKTDNHWIGKNQLGIMLMELREMFK